jgi:protein-S-isoprenylcysteine O-methyltransferase Ste14
MNAVYNWLQPSLWLAWAAYWLAAAMGAKKVERRESWLSRLSHIVPLGLAVWLLSGNGWPGTILNRHVVGWTPALYWTGTALLIAGLSYTVLARRTLGGNWSGTVPLKRDHELIRSGPYRITRHPIYTGLLVALTGSCLANDQWRGVAALLLAVLAFRRKIVVEELFLEAAFPREYELYKARVPALLPSVRSLVSRR